MCAHHCVRVSSRGGPWKQREEGEQQLFVCSSHLSTNILKKMYFDEKF
jgi:hypothetical protein